MLFQLDKPQRIDTDSDNRGQGEYATFFVAENITITEIKRGVLENRYNLFGIIKIANHFETG